MIELLMDLPYTRGGAPCGTLSGGTSEDGAILARFVVQDGSVVELRIDATELVALALRALETKGRRARSGPVCAKALRGRLGRR